MYLSLGKRIGSLLVWTLEQLIAGECLLCIPLYSPAMRAIDGSGEGRMQQQRGTDIYCQHLG